MSTVNEGSLADVWFSVLVLRPICGLFPYVKHQPALFLIVVALRKKTTELVVKSQIVLLFNVTNQTFVVHSTYDSHDDSHTPKITPN